MNRNNQDTRRQDRHKKTTTDTRMHRGNNRQHKHCNKANIHVYIMPIANSILTSTKQQTTMTSASMHVLHVCMCVVCMPTVHMCMCMFVRANVCVCVDCLFMLVCLCACACVSLCVFVLAPSWQLSGKCEEYICNYSKDKS